MFKSKIFLTTIGIGFALAGISALLAYFYEPLRTFFFILAIILFIVHLMFSQLAYVFYLLKRDAYLKSMNMRRCGHCNNPVYKDDEVCPYCKKPLEKETRD